MQDGSSFKETKQNTETPESKVSSSEKLQNGLEKLASKVSELFSGDVKNANDGEDTESLEDTETNEENDSNESKNQDCYCLHFLGSYFHLNRFLR